MGRRKALNEILPLFSPSPSSPIPPPPLPPALHPSSPKRSLLSPVPGGDLKQIQSEVRGCCCAWVSSAAVPTGGGTCHRRLRLSYALAFSIMSLMNKDSRITGVFCMAPKARYLFYFVTFWERKNSTLRITIQFVQAQNRILLLAVTSNIFSPFLPLCLSQGRGQKHIWLLQRK